MSEVGGSCQTDYDCIPGKDLLCINKKCADFTIIRDQEENKECFYNSNCASGLYCRHIEERKDGEKLTSSCQKERTLKEGELCFNEDTACLDGLVCGEQDPYDYVPNKKCVMQAKRDAWYEEQKSNFESSSKVFGFIVFSLMIYAYIISPFLYVRRNYGEKQSYITLLLILSLCIYMEKQYENNPESYGLIIFLVLLPLAIIISIISFLFK